MNIYCRQDANVRAALRLALNLPGGSKGHVRFSYIGLLDDITNNHGNLRVTPLNGTLIGQEKRSKIWYSGEQPTTVFMCMASYLAKKDIQINPQNKLDIFRFHSKFLVLCKHEVTSHYTRKQTFSVKIPLYWMVSDTISIRLRPKMRE